LPNGHTVIADGYGNRVFEVDASGTILWILYGVAYPADIEILEPVTPEVALENLFEDIEDLELNGENFGSILETAFEKLEQGMEEPAVNKIEAFIKMVKAQYDKKKLTAEEALELIEAAEEIIELIEDS
jgi:hypothetical protein